MRSRKSTQNAFLILVILIVILYTLQNVLFNHYKSKSLLRINLENWRNLKKEEIRTLSVLGRIMYLNEKPPAVNTNNNYKILVWKYGKIIERRHLKQYGNKFMDPFEHCSVKNCHITYDNDDLNNADIVIFHMHRMRGVVDLPKSKRDPNQIWAFLIDESPLNIFLYRHLNKIEDYNNIFNWSMNYRYNADIPVPHGRTVPLPDNKEGKIDIETWFNAKKKTPKIAVMGSNCGSTNKRWEYVKALQNFIEIDFYGRCGTMKCENHFDTDCKKLNDYMFYMAFENSNCREYITEKPFWNAYSKNAIPIIMGTTEEYLSKHLPPNSYINVEKFLSPKKLATYVKSLSTDLKALEKFFEWKKYFEVRQEHGYFKSPSFHYCRVCEALNYNSRKPNVYTNLSDWTKNECMPNWQTMLKDKF